MHGLLYGCATLSCQVEALADVKTLEHYTKWMQGTFNLMPDAGYDLKAFAVGQGRNAVCACAAFKGTFTGQGGDATNRQDDEYRLCVCDRVRGR